MDFLVGEFSAAEKAMQFRVGSGCCGWAFETNSQTMFDKVDSHEALRGMTMEQRDATKDIHCILSTPIPRNGRIDDPIGVLNLDSAAPIDEAKFLETAVQTLTAQYAGILGSFLSGRSKRA